jgi:hypothetical protein
MAACSATQPHVMPAAAVTGVKAGGEPRELLYTLGGSPRTRHPFIEVFNARDKSQQPKPLYTIAPRGGGEYVSLSVDSSNQLYAVNFFANGSELDIFPSGSAKPTVSCLLASVSGVSLTGTALYATSFNGYRIDKYALPVHAGRNCPKPSSSVTDQRAALRGTSGLISVAVSPQDRLFDTWETRDEMGKIDEFPPKGHQARRFRSLGQSIPQFITTDSDGNLITDVFGYYNGGKSGESVNLAIIPRESKKIKLFATQGEGVYWAAAFGANERELFVSTDYPAETVQVYAYDAQSAEIGRLLRTYDVSWIEDGTIAVFPGK